MARGGTSNARPEHQLWSLRDLQELLDTCGTKPGHQVRVVELRFGDATSTRNLLDYLLELEDADWSVAGIEHLDALVVVDRMVRKSAAFLDEAIERMEVAAASVFPAVPVDIDIDPAAVTEDSAALDLARRMLEAGTGRHGDALVPGPAIMELASRVIDETPPRDLSLATHELYTRLLNSGTALRHYQLGSPDVEQEVQSLGAQIEDIAGAVQTSRHPPSELLSYLRQVKSSVLGLLNRKIRRREFSSLA